MSEFSSHDNDGWSDWIKSDGTQPPHKEVIIKFRDGSDDGGFAKDFYWPLDGDDCDIVEYQYRVDEEEPKP